MKTLLVILLMSLSITASASRWHYEQGDDGKHYIIDGRKGAGGTNAIEVKNQKAGDKLAKKLNKQKKKDAKTSGFWNEQYCLNPDNRC